MSEYRKLEDIIKALREVYNTPAGHSTGLIALVYAAKTIEDLPAADVVERKRGEWGCERVDFSVAVSPGAYVISSPTCSVCGYHAIDATNYCPNCGAEMRGGKD